MLRQFQGTTLKLCKVRLKLNVRHGNNKSLHPKNAISFERSECLLPITTTDLLTIVKEAVHGIWKSIKLMYLHIPFVSQFQQKFQLNEQHECFDLMFYIIQLRRLCLFVDTFYEHGLLKPKFFVMKPYNYFIKREALLRSAVALTHLVDSCTCRWALNYG